MMKREILGIASAMALMTGVAFAKDAQKAPAPQPSAAPTSGRHRPGQGDHCRRYATGQPRGDDDRAAAARAAAGERHGPATAGTAAS